MPLGQAPDTAVMSFEGSRSSMATHTCTIRAQLPVAAGTPDAIRACEYRRNGVMPEEWSDKRERQYEHIKDSYKDRGVSTDEAEERAARTVNKERREEGETKKKS